MEKSEHQKQDEINYSTKVIIDGREYFQSLAHQLAAYLCKQNFEEYRLTSETGFLSSKILSKKMYRSYFV